MNRSHSASRLASVTVLVTLFTLQLGSGATAQAPVPMPVPPSVVYDVTDLGTLGGNSSVATGINDSGQVVGFSTTNGYFARAFLWQNGAMSDLGALAGGSYSQARGVNDAGQVVGSSAMTANNFPSLAFLWQNGAMSNLGILAGGNSRSQSHARAINESGQVVGESQTTTSGGRAFLWQNGVMSNLGTLGGGDNSSARGINKSGQVVGVAPLANEARRAFLWQSGAMSNLGTLLGGDYSSAYGINTSGQVVGVATSASGSYHAFLWQNGAMSDLGTLGGDCYAYDINDSGQVVGQSDHAFLWQNGVMKDLNDLIDPNSGWVLYSAAAINNAGQIVGFGTHNGQTRAFLLSPSARRPVLILPGIAGTYPANVNDIGPWMFTRGIHPTGLQIDPLAHAYDDLIKTLKNVGYVEGKDLFVVNYDWRIPVGPSDGVFDGVVGGLTATSITDQSFEYGVDYLGYYLRKAMDAWETDHPGTPLEKVNLIAHSTGGLVARTYLQSAAYGGTFADIASPDGTRTLPVVDKLIMVAVPNRGASKPWNTLHDNWGIDLSFQLVLSKILNMGYQKVLAGAIITGPDHDISLSSLLPTACGDIPQICFIKQFNPTARALLATYDFIDFDDGNGIGNINSDPFVRNDLVLDLNAGLDLALNGDPNAFADKATVTAIYGTSVATPTSVVKKVGTAGGKNAIAQFSDCCARDAQPGEVWYDDIVASLSGDGTVPLDSSAGQFFGDSRVTLIPFTNTAPDADGSETPVTHLGLMYNTDVQKQILKILGASYRNADISTTLHSAITSYMSSAWSVVYNIMEGSILGAIFDPVEGFVVDGQGRRLGFSAATGPVTEIPGSVWFGNADGLGWVLEPLVEPLSLQLSGLGSNYYTMVSVLGETGSSGLIERGALGLGALRVLPIPTTTNTSPIANAGPDQTVECASPCAVVTLDGSASFDPDGDTLTYQWSWAGGSASGMAPSVTLPAGAHAVTLTVDDGHGAASSDAVTITVQDTTAPTLTVPANMTANATGPGGAAVIYAASASDVVSGSIVPLCSPASGTTFPIGATTVTCTAADAAGNSATASFRVTVNDVTTPGDMHGAGFIKSNGVKYSFEFRVVERAKRDEERGRFRLEINNDEKKKNDKFVMTDLTFVAFSDDPTYRPGRKARPNMDTVDFHGIGEWNGQSGYRLQVHAADEGEPGRHRESMTIVITDPSGRTMVSIGGVLSGGNVQSTRVRH